MGSEVHRVSNTGLVNERSKHLLEEVLRQEQPSPVATRRNSKAGHGSAGKTGNCTESRRDGTPGQIKMAYAKPSRVGLESWEALSRAQQDIHCQLIQQLIRKPLRCHSILIKAMPQQRRRPL